MARPLVSDELWAIVEPLLPVQPPRPDGGRPRVPDRACLAGILFILKTGCPWEYLPREMGAGSGMTCWRRLRDWTQAGVWDRLWLAVLQRLGRAELLKWSHVVADSCSVRAVFGGRRPAPIPSIGAKAAPNAIC